MRQLPPRSDNPGNEILRHVAGLAGRVADVVIVVVGEQPVTRRHVATGQEALVAGTGGRATQGQRGLVVETRIPGGLGNIIVLLSDY